MAIQLTLRSEILRDRKEGTGTEHEFACRFLLVGERRGRPLYRCEICLRYYDGAPEQQKLGLF